LKQERRTRAVSAPLRPLLCYVEGEDCSHTDDESVSTASSGSGDCLLEDTASYFHMLVEDTASYFHILAVLLGTYDTEDSD
jgi:hypothetical protein